HIADSDGGNGFQLTHGDKSCEQPQWSPDGTTIAFVSSRSGKANVWLIHIRGGGAWRLTDVESGVSSFKWAPDGKSIAFTAVDPPTKEEEKATKEKDDARVVDANYKMNRLYVIAVAQDQNAKRTARKLTTGNYTIRSLLREDLGPYDWSPDSKQI